MPCYNSLATSLARWRPGIKTKRLWALFLSNVGVGKLRTFCFLFNKNLLFQQKKGLGLVLRCSKIGLG